MFYIDWKAWKQASHNRVVPQSTLALFLAGSPLRFAFNLRPRRDAWRARRAETKKKWWSRTIAVSTSLESFNIHHNTIKFRFTLFLRLSNLELYCHYSLHSGRRGTLTSPQELHKGKNFICRCITRKTYTSTVHVEMCALTGRESRVSVALAIEHRFLQPPS